jgi:queuosine precursor transporter
MDFMNSVSDAAWRPRYFHILAACFAPALIITNVFSFKFINIAGIKFGAGTLMFPVCLILGDIITEIYGFKRARQVIITSLVCFFVYTLISQLVIALPPDASWPHQASLEAVFALAPRIFVAGTFAYLAGELSNSWVMFRMKQRHQHQHFCLRALVSTCLGELLNSAVFFLVAFAGVYPLPLIASLIINGTILKTLIEVIMLPLTMLVVKKLRRLEGLESSIVPASG